MRYLIRDKNRSYGVFDERYATRAEAEENLWRHSGGDLVIEEDTSRIEWREAVDILDTVVAEYSQLSTLPGMPSGGAVVEALNTMKRGY